jgi:hypothetical protein
VAWLPATAWEDREISAYVPSTYLVGGDMPDQLIAQLPAAVADLLRAKAWDQGFATFTTDEARALAAALDEAGLEQDGLLNAYQLDYQYEYTDETGNTVVVHVVFTDHAGCETPAYNLCSSPLLSF